MRRGTRRLTAALTVGVLAACSNSGDGDAQLPDSVPIATSPSSIDAGTAATTTPASIGTSDVATSATGPAESTPATDGSATTPPSEPASTEAPTTSAAPTTTLRPTSTVPPDPAAIAFVALGSTSSPTNVTYRNGDNAFYIVSQEGFIVAMRDGVVDPTRLLDISGDVGSGGERGLLGLAFSVDGSHAYVDYTNNNGDTEIVEFAVSPEGVFDPASRRLLLTIDQPYANHNGGQVRIGPDGYLYIGMGDGGSGGDPERRALNVGNPLGKLLRIDPNPVGDSPYSVPPDNPFVGVDGARPEIWSVGLRTPWRFSFDLATNDLWIADVGQGEWEEIDVAWADQGGGRGVNYGWSAFEGTHRFNEDQPADGTVPPIFEYPHGPRGCSVSGGVRYRGEAIPSLYGWYVYADYCNGEVRALEIRDDRSAGAEVILTSDIDGVSEVAQGPDGELFVISVTSGSVFAVRPSG